ncbi:hypothetical protein AgCh_003414 [Apium graveolens]
MKVELNALENNQTWEIVQKPPNTHIVDCKWLFKIKYLPDGSIERYKDHLVAKGFAQTYELDYFETFAPVAKMTIILLLIAIVASQNWHISQFDVTNAFLYGDINEEICMNLPSGFLQLTSLTLVSHIKDPESFKEVIIDTGPVNAQPSVISMEQSHTLQNNSSPLLSTAAASSYRRLVGRLINLTVTHPNLAYDVQVLSQFLATPRHDHPVVAHRVVCYIKNAPGQGILMSTTSPITLVSFCDSNWGGCKESRQSLTG